MPPILPAAAFHFEPCLPPPVAETIAARLKEKIAKETIKIPERNSLTLIPTPHVQTACVDGAQRVGLWLRPPSSSQATEYSQGLANLDLLRSGETFAVLVSKPRLIDPVADRFWQALPKRWTRNNPNPADDGKIHIRGFELTFDDPNRVVTKLKGTYRATGPNPDFTVTLTDTLSASQGLLKCTSDQDVDFSFGFWEWLLGAVIAGPIGVIGLKIGELVGEDIAGAAVPSDAGFGGLIISQAPGAIALPPPGLPGGIDQVAFRYARVAVSSDSIAAGGTLNLS